MTCNVRNLRGLSDNRILIEDFLKKCYERKYEPFDLYLLSEHQEKKISYCQFSCHTFQASASSQCQKPALVEKCDKTGPNLLGNGQKFCKGR